ncbi:MAG: ribonuclease HII [Bacteroidia bacterium]|nr:ribonuclease HII [Bacteroidia bacterium]MDG2042188.1 ribonuclease HII [Bacteroidia bacterium]|tara:strand:- start:3503 stop:4093 length:591 start_codon:yes stop_codon:yes gene_type:complete
MLKSYFNKNVLEAGCDEAGRGCLAGPVYAAAVILPPRLRMPLLNDSKKLSLATRNLLREQIEKKAVAWAVASCSEREIEKYNILNCSILAMQRAVQQLSTRPEHLLIDGNQFKPFDFYSYTNIVKGDAKYKSIAAASILAKTHRDEYMIQLSEKYPEFGFEKHKGYGTKKHLEAIQEFGYLICHRKTFQLKNLNPK